MTTEHEKPEQNAPETGAADPAQQEVVFTIETPGTEADLPPAPKEEPAKEPEADLQEKLQDKPKKGKEPEAVHPLEEKYKAENDDFLETIDSGVGFIKIIVRAKGDNLIKCLHYRGSGGATQTLASARGMSLEDFKKQF